MCVCVCVCEGQIDPEHFGAFDATFLTLFYVTGGELWPETLPKVSACVRAGVRACVCARVCYDINFYVL